MTLALLTAGYDMSSEEWLEEEPSMLPKILQKSPEQLRMTLERKAQPRSLAQLSRLVIVRSLGEPLWVKAKELFDQELIHRSLYNYLRFTDLELMEREFENTILRDRKA